MTSYFSRGPLVALSGAGKALAQPGSPGGLVKRPVSDSADLGGAWESVWNSTQGQVPGPHAVRSTGLGRRSHFFSRHQNICQNLRCFVCHS